MTIATKSNNQMFSGFMDIYDKSRPICPKEIIAITKLYLNRNIETVVDIGCGTGLSTTIWVEDAKKIIGIDINEEMINYARKKHPKRIEYINSSAENTLLKSKSVDVVVSCQSFHWMNPEITLEEVNRILKPLGIFLIVDYDWPPVMNWKIEQAFESLIKQLNIIKNNMLFLDSSAYAYPKNKHLINIRNSGYFQYSREFVFSNKEQCDANRFIAMALSQQSTQALLKKHYQEVSPIIKKFENIVYTEFKDQIFDIKIGYRVRMGIKNN